MNTAFQQIEKLVGHTFTDQSLLELALTHSSLKNENDNERLEFLGDRVLGLVVAELVFEKFPSDDEGLLAKRHTALVRQEMLAKIAVRLDLGSCLKLSPGEEKSGGRRKASILSDSLEAVIAAIYLDGGFAQAEAFIQQYWSGELTSVQLKDAKSHLQEWLQSHKEELPTYTLVMQKGEAHEALFVMKVTTENYGEAIGEGSSKQQAEQSAAENLLLELGEDITS